MNRITHVKVCIVVLAAFLMAGCDVLAAFRPTPEFSILYENGGQKIHCSRGNRHSALDDLEIILAKYILMRKKDKNESLVTSALLEKAKTDPMAAMALACLRIVEDQI